LANHKSAIKRAKQNEQNRIRNRSRRTRMKHAIRSLEEALASQNPEQAMSRLKEAVSVIDKTASKGVIHRNLASRKISRMTQKVNALAPPA
jgi:small subunit ribosomal protein S20